MKKLTESQVLKYAKRHMHRLFPERKDDFFVEVAYQARDKRLWVVPIKSSSVDLDCGQIELGPRGGLINFTVEEDISKAICDRFAIEQGCK